MAVWENLSFAQTSSPGSGRGAGAEERHTVELGSPRRVWASQICGASSYFLSSFASRAPPRGCSRPQETAVYVLSRVAPPAQVAGSGAPELLPLSGRFCLCTLWRPGPPQGALSPRPRARVVRHVSPRRGWVHQPGARGARRGAGL